ncbi:hypothetical protein lerEdw1_003133 [Lerista edwardsae]|nr:hypothetical protein lerEdw1_003133 [Lerista edwardsae]
MDAAGRPSTGQVLLLATSSAITAVLYAIYRQKAKVVNSLKVSRSLNSSSSLILLVLKTNDYAKVIHQRTNTTVFDLVPQDEEAGVAVRVLKPLDATELSLETVYEKFHPSVQSFTDVIGHYISGERPKGIQETEEMLKVGSVLTGVGELVLDHATIKLQPPQAGLALLPEQPGLRQPAPEAGVQRPALEDPDCRVWLCHLRCPLRPLAQAVSPPPGEATVAAVAGVERSGRGRPPEHLRHLPEQPPVLRLSGVRAPVLL